MQIAVPRMMGVTTAIAATGMAAKANEPPANIPAQRHVISSCPPFVAPAKKPMGKIAHMLPKMNAFRTSR